MTYGGSRLVCFPFLHVSMCMLMDHRPLYVYVYDASGPHDMNDI